MLFNIIILFKTTIYWFSQMMNPRVTQVITRITPIYLYHVPCVHKMCDSEVTNTIIKETQEVYLDGYINLSYNDTYHQFVYFITRLYKSYGRDK